MIIRIYLDRSRFQSHDVEIDEETTCADVILECKGGDETKTKSCYLTELCMGYERAVDNSERPLEILRQWGGHADKVQFFLRRKVPSLPNAGTTTTAAETKNDIAQSASMPPDILLGTDYSTEKLQKMAAKQREKLEEQQKVLSNRTQQLSALQQQQLKQQEMETERNQRLSAMKERIREKEAKLKKLRAIKSLVQEQSKTNAQYLKELDKMKNSFEKKEQELTSSIERMEILKKQLKDQQDEQKATRETEVGLSAKRDKLSEQILKCNLINSQNTRLLQKKRDSFTHRQKQIAEFAEKINKYRSRLSAANQQKLKRKLRHAPTSKTERKQGAVTDVDEFYEERENRYSTLPHGLKFTDVELFNRNLELGDRDKKTEIVQAAVPPPDLCRDVVGEVGELHDRRGASARANLRPGSAPAIQPGSRKPCTTDDVRLFATADENLPPAVSSISKASEFSGSGANRHSSHLLMSHFAPRPYESKYSIAKSTSHTAILPSNALSIKKESDGFGAGNWKAGSVTTSLGKKPGGYPSEILITDPPSAVSSASKIPSRSDRGDSVAGLKVEVKEPRWLATQGDFQTRMEHRRGYAEVSPSGSRTSSSSEFQPCAPGTQLDESVVSGEMEKGEDNRLSLHKHPSSGSGTPSSVGRHSQFTFSQNPTKYKSSSFEETSEDSPLTGHTRGGAAGGSFQNSTGPASLYRALSANPAKSSAPSILHIVNAKSEKNPIPRPTSGVAFSAVDSAAKEQPLLYNSRVFQSSASSNIVASSSAMTSPASAKFPSSFVTSKSKDATSYDQLSGLRSYKEPLSNFASEKKNFAFGKHSDAFDAVDGSAGEIGALSLKSLPKPLLNEASGGEMQQSVGPPHLNLRNGKSGQQSPSADQPQVSRSPVIGTIDVKSEQKSGKTAEITGVYSERMSRPLSTSPTSKVADRTGSATFAVVRSPDVKDLSIFGSDLERVIHKPINPRPVRRRMSSGDVAEDYPNKAPSRDDVNRRNNGSTLPGRVSSFSGDTVTRALISGNVIDISYQSPSVAGTKPDSVEKKNSFSRQPFRRQGNLKRAGKPKLMRRVSFEPLALLLDASLEGELDLVEKTAREVPDVSASNDEGITALHNAICAGHVDIVRFLVEFGCDVNSPDSDGWTPLHCAASCNNLTMTQFLVEHGACIFATTYSDQELASDKCEEDEDGYDTCCHYLQDIQNNMGFSNECIVYAVFDYEAENPDELSFRSGDRIQVLRKGDEHEQEWWWSRQADSEGYVPRNLIGFYPRVVPQWLRFGLQTPPQSL